MDDDLARFEPILTLFFAGRLPGMNHARHIAVANIVRRLPHGLALMHLGLQITAIRAGVPEKYDREVTNECWERLTGPLPALAEFADIPLGGPMSDGEVAALAPDSRSCG